VRRWCEDRSARPGATVPLEQLWRLARSWYDDRLEPDWRRRTPAERQALLDAAGLTGPFWSLTP
jgi:hypothetical protein